MQNLKKIINKITASNRIAVISHVSPDGDAVGSSLALAIALRNSGRTVDVYLEDGVPNVYSFLTASDTVLSQWIGKEYDAVIALDTGDIDRLGKCVQVFNSTTSRINIDHHITNTSFGDYNYIDAKASSAGEIVYNLIGMLGLGINKEIAECLYVAIATDTGGFRYGNTTSKSMQAAAELLTHDIDVSGISRRVFELVTEKKVRLLGNAIGTLEISSGGRLALMYLSNQDKERLGAAAEDFDGIVNIARNIAGVEAAAFLVEIQPMEIKVNFRSNTYVDVSTIAVKHGGGGHKRAAGCTIIGISLLDVKTQLKKELEKELH